MLVVALPFHREVFAHDTMAILTHAHREKIERMSVKMTNPVKQEAIRYFTFKEVFDFLCEIGSIGNERKATFCSRLQQLQRLGFPVGVNVGQGKKMKYSRAHVFQIAFAFEMFAVGLAPRVVIETTNNVWSSFTKNFQKNNESSDLEMEIMLETKVLLSPKVLDFAIFDGFEIVIEDAISIASRVSDICNNLHRCGIVIINSGRIFEKVESF